MACSLTPIVKGRVTMIRNVYNDKDYYAYLKEKEIQWRSGLISFNMYRQLTLVYVKGRYNK